MTLNEAFLFWAEHNASMRFQDDHVVFEGSKDHPVGPIHMAFNKAEFLAAENVATEYFIPATLAMKRLLEEEKK